MTELEELTDWLDVDVTVRNAERVVAEMVALDEGASGMVVLLSSMAQIVRAQAAELKRLREVTTDYHWRPKDAVETWGLRDG